MPDENTDDFEVVVRARRFDQGGEVDGVPAYVLDERISGHDSYRPAQLVVGSQPPVSVRVLTLDDITIVYPLSFGPGSSSSGSSSSGSFGPGSSSPEAGPVLPDEWEGTLRLAAARRGPKVPEDLAAALRAAGADLDALDPAQRRHLIGFVAEARPGLTRNARIAAAVEAAIQAGRPR